MTTDRLDREREFHNERFTEETRHRQQRFYPAVHGAFDFYEAQVVSRAAGRDVLEYGCATGAITRRIAPAARSATGIDLSDAAVARATAEARAQGLANTSFAVMDAENMDFDDGSFDLVFGSGIIHHLDTRRSLNEVARVLRPGGVAIFIEPLGVNPVLNAYRRRTPGARTPDEHPLVPADFAVMREVFANVQVRWFALSVVAATAVHGTRAFMPVRRALEGLDRVLLSSPLRWHAWFAVVGMQRSHER